MSDLTTCLPAGDYDVHTRTHNGREMRWRDRDGVIHAAEGAHVHRGVTLLWTRCEAHDVPANSAYASAEEPTCPRCREIVNRRTSDV